MHVYGWVFLAAGAVFVFGAAPLGRLLNLAAASLPGSAPLPHAVHTFWLALAGSMMAMISYLAFVVARDPRQRPAWNALLLSKGMSASLVALYALWDRNAAFLAGAAVDGAILAHLAFLRRGLPPLGAGELLAPRFLPGGGPFYEVWFAKLNDPATRDALWLRYVLTRGRAGENASLWFVFFDRADGKVHQGRADSPLSAVELGRSGRPVRLKDGWLSADRLCGRAAAASWDLVWEALPAPAFRFVPPSLSLAGLAASDYWTPAPLARFSGVFTLEGRARRFDGALGSVGHLWGRRLADEWRWAHAVLDDGGEPAVFEILSARLRLGALRSPWLTTANLWRKGRHQRSDSLGAALGNSSRPADGTWAFRVAFPGLVVEGECVQDARLTAELGYEGPCGERRTCRNSKTAAMRLKLSADGGAAETLATEDAAAVEFTGAA